MVQLKHKTEELTGWLRELPRDTRKSFRYFAIFLALMATLTLLSNAASGATIAHITATYPIQTSISDSVETTGTVNAKSKESVRAPAGLRVEHLTAGLGSKVKSGDELLFFDMEELESQIKKLDIDLAGLKVSAQILGVSNQSTDALEAQQEQEALKTAELELESLRGSLQRSVDKADRDYREATRDYSKARSEYRASDSGDSDVVGALTRLDKAETKVETARANFDSKQNAYNKLLETSSDPEVLATAKAALDAAEEAMAVAEKNYQTALGNYDDAIAEAAGSADEEQEQASRDYEQLKNARDKLYSARTFLEESKIEQKEQLDKADRAIAELELRGDISAVSRQNQQQSVWSQSLKAQSETKSVLFEIEQKQTELALLEELKKSNGKLISSTSGILIQINLDSDSQLRGKDAIQIATAEDGYEATAKLSSGDIEDLRTGMNAIVDINGKKVAGELSNISIYPDDEQQVEITVKLPEDAWQDGQSGKIVIERSKEVYDACIPLGALRSDSEGDFIYILEEVQTIMGIQTTLRRVPVEVLMRDDQNAAVKGAIGHDSQILVTSNKLVSGGDRVRLMENVKTAT